MEIVKHNHTHCNHQFIHCIQCDVVYCNKCGEEWKKQFYTSTGTWTNPCYPNITHTSTTDSTLKHNC